MPSFTGSMPTHSRCSTAPRLTSLSPTWIAPLAFTRRISKCSGLGIADVLGIRAGARAIARCWRLHVERFVRADLVVLVSPAAESEALRLPIAGRRRSRVGLERAVHPFVPPVLLGVAHLDALRENAQLNPPHAEAREPRDRSRGERRSVVAPHAQRQSVLAKRRFEHAFGRVVHRAFKRHATQQEAAVRVRKRQRVGSSADSRGTCP